MPHLQLTLTVAADPAPFEDALLAAGAVAITLQDAGDEPVLEPAPGTTPLWPQVLVKALFEASADPQAVLGALRAELPQLPADASFETLADRAWEREWLKDFRPMRFGRRLWICPGGQRPPAADLEAVASPGSPVDSPVIIELDPGLAFGTGTHPTTALCLEWLDGAPVAGKSLIDYGCGSGVLAIAGLKLGARQALAIDIDPQALQATGDNAARNGVDEPLTVRMADEPVDVAADILLANILSQPLLALAATFARLVLPGGRLVLSGILRSQVEAVASRYAPWFDMAPATVRGDWVRLDGIRSDW